MEQTKRALAVIKVNRVEWLANGKIEGSPLTIVSGATNDLDGLHSILKKNDIKIDTASACNDWVDVTRTVDNRISVLTPDTFVVLWDDSSVSILDGVKDVNIENGQPVVQF